MRANAQANDDVFLNSRQVMQRYGGASHMWIIRRQAQDGFPGPTYLGRQRFWRLANLIAWERAQATKGAQAAPPPKPKAKTKKR